MSETLDASNTATLLIAARAAAANAYAPYSGYHVGAALQLSDGTVVTGANVENASYGLTLCAETVAVAKLANAGRLGDLMAVLIVGGRPDGDRLVGSDPVHPCGRCRQMLNEAAQQAQCDIIVHCASGDGGQIATYPLSTLLPHSFGPKDLGLIGD